VRCGRCGNENAEANRFCGMCGAALVAKTQAAGQAAGQAPQGPAGLGSTTAERRATTVSPSDARPKTGPVITGPSFLGLSTPGPARDLYTDPPDAHPPAGRDALQPSSGNLDYLLEDEEEPKRGWGKLILVVVALALAVGFGYLHWKQGGFDWLNARDKKPAAAAPTPDGGLSADSGGSGTAASTDGTAGQGGGATGTAAASPAESTASPASGSQTSSQSTAPQNPASQNPPSQNPPTDPNLPANAASQPAGSDADKQSPPAELPAEPKAGTHKALAAKPAVAKPFDAVTEAERYIYGRGVRQDCDHGLRLLKPAAEKSNAKAMASMGALYSTGTCTPRDLPTAYRWFALALHKEPDNQALQEDLKNLWEKMTQPERQLAIKLSQ
jgi:hypothetical protein